MIINEEKYKSLDELDLLYLELGFEYYKRMFDDPLPQLLPLFDRITTNLSKNTHHICKQCGTELIEGSTFCHKCGCHIDNDRVLKKVCKNCGNILGLDAVFCNNCGSKL